MSPRCASRWPAPERGAASLAHRHRIHPQRQRRAFAGGLPGAVEGGGGDHGGTHNLMIPLSRHGDFMKNMKNLRAQMIHYDTTSTTLSH